MFKYIISGLLIILVIFLSVIDENKTVYPEEVYTVYLDGQMIGMVESKEVFMSYIDQKADQLKEEFSVEQVFGPTTLQVVKNLTYHPQTSDYEEVFNNIKEPLSIEGYQITIRGLEEEQFFVNHLEIFDQAVRNIIVSFVGSENYENYLSGEQLSSENMSKIENVGLDNNITYRKLKIPVNQEIYTSAELLSKQLLFGTTEDQATYVVKEGDTIEEVAFQNEISIEEFLVSNTQFTSKNNLLYEGQEVVIGITDPKVSVVVEEYVVEEVEVAYKTETKYDATKTIGYVNRVQNGEKGLERLTRNVKTINGVVVYSDLLAREELVPAVNEVVVRGEKFVSNVASPYAWTWPTGPGWKVTSGYAYRVNPITRERHFHQAIDIAIGYGAHIYAANSGTIDFVGSNASYGYYVVINHNNSQNNYTLYAHLDRYIVNVGQTVSAGSLIGYMGSTGSSTGPHLHFEVWIGKPWHGGSYHVNPMGYLR